MYGWMCDVPQSVLGLTPKAMSAVFDDWNKGELNSFLIEITRDILGAPLNFQEQSAVFTEFPRLRGREGRGAG